MPLSNQTNSISHKDIVIANCNLKKLKEQKREIEEKNQKIAAKNKSLKVREVLLTILLTLVVSVITGFAMLYVWYEVEFDPNNTILFRVDMDAKWVKLIVEVAILLLGISVFRILASYIKFNHQKKALNPVSYTEQIHFASVVENNEIINLQFYRLMTNAIGVSQPITFSFDVVNEKGITCNSFASETGKWKGVITPGAVKTLIDAENLIVFIPYYGENEGIQTLETAYMNEKLRRTELEQMLGDIEATHLSKEKDVHSRLKREQTQNELLQKELITKNRLLEQAKAEKETLLESRRKEQEANNQSSAQAQDQIDTLKAERESLEKIFDAEREALKAGFAEEKATLIKDFEKEKEDLKAGFVAEKETMKKQIDEFDETKNSMQTEFDNEKFALLNQIEETSAALKESETKCSALDDDVQKLSTKLKEETAEKEALAASMSVINQQHEEHVRKITNELTAQMQAEKENFEKTLAEKTAEFEKNMHDKDLAQQHLLGELESEKSEMQVDYEERIRELTENAAIEAETQRLVNEEEVQSLRAQAAKNKDEANTLRKENEQLLVHINQLEHNSKVNQGYHTDLKNELNNHKLTIRELQKEIEEYKNKEVVWTSAQNTIEEQKRIINNLEERIAVHVKQKETLEAQLRDAKDLAVISENECESMQATLEKLQDANKQNVSLTQSNTALRDRNKKLSEENANLTRSAAEAKDALDRVSSKNADLEKERDRLAKDLLSLQEKLNSSQNYVSSLEYDLSQARKETDEQKKSTNNANKETPATESSAFDLLMKKREEQIRKAREEATAAKRQNGDQ